MPTLAQSPKELRRACANPWLLAGPLPIPGICDIVAEYGNGLEWLRTLGGHPNSVTALAVLPDGKLASGSRDEMVHVWDAASGACLLTLAGHTDSVFALAVLPDGKLASGSNDNTVRVWDAASGACLLTLAGHTSDVVALAVLPDGKLAS